MMIMLFVIGCLIVYLLTLTIEPEGLFTIIDDDQRQCNECGQLQERVYGERYAVSGHWYTDGPVRDPDCDCNNYVTK